MASRTQIRLEQLTGSAVDLKTEAQQYVAPATAVALTGSDVRDLFGMVGAALNRIHGAASDEPFNSAEGTFATSVFDVNSTGNITIDSSGGTIKIGADDVNQNITIGEDGTRTIQIGAGDGTSTTTINSRGGTLLLDATGRTLDADVGTFDVDATAAATINAVGASTFTTNGVLTISGSTGLNLQSHSGEIDITSTQGAIDINATGAGVDIDAGAASAFNTSAGKITIAGAAGEDIGTSGQTTTLKGELNVDEAATFDDNVTIAGNLDVNGTTTTIDTVNLSIEDSIIALGVSGSNGGYSQTGDRGIIFPRGVVGSATNGFWFDGSQFNLASSNTGPTSGSFASVNSYSDLVLGDATLKNNSSVLTLGTAQTFVLTHANANNTATVTSGHRLAFGAAGQYLSGDGTDLSIVSSADLALNVAGNDITLESGVNEIGRIKFDRTGDGLIISSSAGEGLMLDSNMGSIVLGKDSAGGGDEGVSLQLISNGLQIESPQWDPGDNAIAFKFAHSDTFASQFLQVSGTIRFNEEAANGSNYVALRSQAAVDSSYTIQLPNGIGSANEVVTIGSIDGTNALLSFTDLSTLTAPSKAVRIITGSHTAGATVKFSSAAEITGDTISSLSSAGSQGSTLDVYVNGQLLVSGSSTERSDGDRDYDIFDNGVRFAFDLEIDDIVQAIKR